MRLCYRQDRVVRKQSRAGAPIIDTELPLGELGASPVSAAKPNSKRESRTKKREKAHGLEVNTSL